jgi:hypothetical protein
MRVHISLWCVLIVSLGFIACRCKHADVQVEPPYTRLIAQSPLTSFRCVVPVDRDAGLLLTPTRPEIPPSSTSSSVRPKQDKTLPCWRRGRDSFRPKQDRIRCPAHQFETLQAKRVPRSVRRVDSLPFTFALLGTNLTRSEDGSFSEKAKGNWTTTKIFLANDLAEVYFNYNPVLHTAEFSIKDPDDGDKILPELAKVF